MLDVMLVLKDKRILVVDDDGDICSLVAEDLAMCDVDAARTFELAKAKLDANRYDVVILDVMGVRGYDLLAKYGRDVPCIILTARARAPEDLERARTLGAALYVPKSDIGRLDIYLAKVVDSDGPLWAWLFEFCDFTTWFGRHWRPPADTTRSARSSAN
jgi:DNA-binding NtrC family response regulator